MKYGLIGKSLVHSYSKEIHEELGKYEYQLFSLAPEEMSDFIRSRDFGGLNVTIPYKKDVMELCDEISPLASAIGAVNTLYFEDGKLKGHNTDYEGFLYNAARSNIRFKDKKVLILGNGGTSLTARKAISDEGASAIYIASRSLCEGAADNMLTYDRLHKIASEIQIVVNTTPVGTYPNTMESVISLADYPACEAVIDVIYNPFKTALILEAEKLGLQTANGLPMLVAQATAAAGYFLGTPGAFISENERIIEKLKYQMQNIVLIGMPGCGKSTVGRLISQRTGKELVDMDEEIIKRAGMNIPEIFEKYGEKHFRDLESQVAADLGKERNLVIATGGGTVLRPENVDHLRQNAVVIHILRPTCNLSTDGRPLSKDINTLMEMEKVRMPIYQSAADIEYDNSKPKSLAEIAEEVMILLKGGK